MPKLIAALALVLFLALGAGAVAQGTLNGPAVAIDGDNLRIGERVVQLFAIDAPELGQTCLNEGRRWRCGLDAALALRKLMAFGPVRCAVLVADESKAYGRCESDSGDLALALLHQGYAVALQDAPDAYRAAQAAARAARLGIWRGEFVEPSAWRRGRRLPNGPADEVEVCDIKGVINGAGLKVYYVPTDDGFGAVVIDEAKGERTFCSDDEARLAGWRHLPK